MAIFAEGDIVAVELDSASNSWAYGYLVEAGYAKREWRVAFPDGSERLVPYQLIREDRRDKDDDPYADYLERPAERVRADVDRFPRA